MKILWIEKYFEYVDFYLEQLGLTNHDVLCCTDFSEAKHILSSQKIDLIIASHNPCRFNETNDFQTIYGFYDDLESCSKSLPFIIYSDWAFKDERYGHFSSLKNFFFVKKHSLSKKFDTSHLKNTIESLGSLKKVS